MTDDYTQHLKISSSDGKNVVESVISDIQKKADKGQVEFGVDIRVERVEVPDKEVDFNDD